MVIVDSKNFENLILAQVFFKNYEKLLSRTFEKLIAAQIIDQLRIVYFNKYRTRAKISSAYSKLTRFLDALIFEHFQNLSYILANFNVFKACLWLKYTFKIYCYALVSTIISKK